MAIIQGIAGYSGTITDGKGGNTPLDLQLSVLQGLSTRGFSYKVATPHQPANVSGGSITYRIPEIVQVGDYTKNGKDGGRFQGIAAGDITITIDIRRGCGVEYEDFDYSRLGDMASIVSSAISSLGMAIEKDLNLHFFSFLENAFRPDDKTFTPPQGNAIQLPAGEMRQQSLVLPALTKDGATKEEVKKAIYDIQRFMIKLSKTYNKQAMGIEKSQFMLMLDPYADVNIRQIYDNQPNSLAERGIADDLVGYKLGAGIEYFLDGMIGNEIVAGTSFNEDKTLDTTDFCGFIVHNEAIAMPMNLKSVHILKNQDTANTRWLCKYQFGIGGVRPGLVYAIVNKNPKAKSKGR